MLRISFFLLVCLTARTCESAFIRNNRKDTATKLVVDLPEAHNQVLTVIGNSLVEAAKAAITHGLHVDEIRSQNAQDPMMNELGTGIFKRSNESIPDIFEGLIQSLVRVVFGNAEKVLDIENHRFVQQHIPQDDLNTTAIFDCVLYINMDEAKEKHLQMESMLSSAFPDLHRERIRGMTPEETDIDFDNFAKEVHIPDLAREMDVFHMSGQLPFPQFKWLNVLSEWACLGSHMRALKRAIELKSRGQIHHNCLILEDDAQIGGDRKDCRFEAENRRLPPDWDILKMFFSLPLTVAFSSKAYVLNVDRAQRLYDSMLNYALSRDNRFEKRFTPDLMFAELGNVWLLHEPCVG